MPYVRGPDDRDVTETWAWESTPGVYTRTSPRGTRQRPFTDDEERWAQGLRRRAARDAAAQQSWQTVQADQAAAAASATAATGLAAAQRDQAATVRAMTVPTTVDLQSQVAGIRDDIARLADAVAELNRWRGGLDSALLALLAPVRPGQQEESR